MKSFKLHCTSLHCTSLHCIVLHCTTRWKTTLYNSALSFTALNRGKLHCRTLHWASLPSATICAILEGKHFSTLSRQFQSLLPAALEKSQWLQDKIEPMWMQFNSVIKIWKYVKPYTILVSEQFCTLKTELRQNFWSCCTPKLPYLGKSGPGTAVIHRYSARL